MPSDCQPRHVQLTVLPSAGARPASRMSRKRFAVLLVVQVLMIVHVVHWLWAGTTLAPIEPSESMETVKDGVVTVGTVFFALALGSTAILGLFARVYGETELQKTNESERVAIEACLAIRDAVTAHASMSVTLQAKVTASSFFG